MKIIPAIFEEREIRRLYDENNIRATDVLEATPIPLAGPETIFMK